MKKTLSFLSVLLLNTAIFAQSENDILRYSTTDVFGSARFEAMAGSFGALGADFSAIQINPAGMGRFSSSNTSISFNNSSFSNDAVYNDRLTKSSHNKFTVSSAGMVISTDISELNYGRKYSQFTFGYTRLKNFSNSRRYEGQNFYSLLDVFANSGKGIDPENIYDAKPFTTGLAYDVFALDYDPSSGQYISRLTPGDMYHNRQIETDGGIGEFHIGYSENYMNKFYYGASIGIRRIKYDERFNHNERLLDTIGTTLRSFDYSYEQTTRGTGFNLKLGVLFLPSEQFRLGLAFESPTIISLNDQWTANMTALHDDGLKFIDDQFIPDGEFDYRMKTPMKLRGSFAYILGMRGAINVELEMSRLPGGRLKPDNTIESTNVYEFNDENSEAKNQFRTIVNTRIGMEYMIFTDLFLRGGIAILPQPYNKELGNVSTPNMTYSGGIGWDNNTFSLDLSYRLLELHSDYYAFDATKIENRTEFKTQVHNIVLTARLKF
ncbi:hypothetical protein [Brumimicrobium mesophilum]|uniref:hypothetical protein n=1 Tax=Brumimicrobium mesophilum TaxID=392717 RepID=UPI000D13F3F8|nr:hypothetical protein [Brumimicrobium mesophilum]